MLELTLLANAIWFGMGFHLFALRSNIFAKILVSTAHRETPTFDVLAATLPFLGGFNLSLCVLNLLFLINVSFFPEDEQKIILFAVFALAHGSQFVSNIPIAFDNLKGKGVWQIKGLMRFIFITDFALMAANLALVVTFAW
jgi:hypothetical protein|tara:strand:+ start:203 stop:625 length:423 start_codon:yes stop_codon:yes gene_type:complete